MGNDERNAQEAAGLGEEFDASSPEHTRQTVRKLWDSLSDQRFLWRSLTDISQARS